MTVAPLRSNGATDIITRLTALTTIFNLFSSQIVIIEILYNTFNAHLPTPVCQKGLRVSENTLLIDTHYKTNIPFKFQVSCFYYQTGSCQPGHLYSYI